MNAAVAIYLFFRMPESPRWLEAGTARQGTQDHRADEARVSKGGRIACRARPAPYEGVAEEKTNMFAPFGRQYVVVTRPADVMVLGYAGIVYGGASQIILYLIGKGGYSAGGSSP